MPRTAIVIGNCQASAFAAHLAAGLPSLDIKVIRTRHDADVTSEASGRDLVFLQSQKIDRVTGVVRYPNINFQGFHPDSCYLYDRQDGKKLAYRSPLHHYHSAIVTASFCLGLKHTRVATLFNAYIYEPLGYFDAYDRARQLLIRSAQSLGIDLAPSIDKWLDGGPFMHTVNHPVQRVMTSIVRDSMSKAGLSPTGDIDAPGDLAARGAIWPIYPEIARRIGVPGGTTFMRPAKWASREISLDQFIAESYKHLRKVPLQALEKTSKVGLAINILTRELGREISRVPRHELLDAM